MEINHDAAAAAATSFNWIGFMKIDRRLNRHSKRYNRNWFETWHEREKKHKCRRTSETTSLGCAKFIFMFFFANVSCSACKNPKTKRENPGSNESKDGYINYVFASSMIFNRTWIQFFALMQILDWQICTRTETMSTMDNRSFPRRRHTLKRVLVL